MGMTLKLHASTAIGLRYFGKFWCQKRSESICQENHYVGRHDINLRH